LKVESERALSSLVRVVVDNHLIFCLHIKLITSILPQRTSGVSSRDTSVRRRRRRRRENELSQDEDAALALTGFDNPVNMEHYICICEKP
jgi:hypothetical protein